MWGDTFACGHCAIDDAFEEFTREIEVVAIPT